MLSPLKTGSIAGASLALAAGGLAYAAFYPTSRLFGDVLIAGSDPGEIALTFDDGPNPSITPRLLDLLSECDVRATFFLIGQFVRQQGPLARDIAARGHLVGNHTMTHPRLTWQSNGRIVEELSGANAVIEDAVGAPVRYLRPPHGARRPFVMQTARELGLATVQWNITAHDWNPIGRETIVRNVERGILRNQRRGHGSNVLLHDGGHLGLNAPRMPTLEATGTLLRSHEPSRFVTVDLWDDRAPRSAIGTLVGTR